MSAHNPGIPRQEIEALVRQVKSTQLFNRQLSSVCQVNGLKSTGVKADLQTRIANLIQEVAASGDASRFAQVKQSISNAFAQRNGSGGPAKQSAAYGGINPSAGVSNPMQSYGSSMSHGYSMSNGHRPGQVNRNILSAPTLAFKDSPFYSIKALLGDVRICEAMSQHRNTVSIQLRTNDMPLLNQCVTDPSYRVMIFCAAEATGVQDVAFPHQSEIRVNGTEIKANLRGLKNKPGSTRPVDVTHALRLKIGHYPNSIDFTYALTTKKFYILANLCQIQSVAELASAVSTRRRIPKDSVIAELNEKAQDPDVITTSSVLSLKCPLSYMRLEVPCRGLLCAHIQCFDATSYLQLQEQGPQWLCPICNKSTPYEQLAVDEYVKDILDSTPKSLETVTIEPTGRWLMKSEESEGNNFPSESYFNDTSGFGSTAAADDDDDDDDLVEISEVNFLPTSANNTRLTGTPSRPTPMGTSTPTSAGRSSAAPRANGHNSAKRPAPAVIDLTLSSDEDEEPIQRPAKRQRPSMSASAPAPPLPPPSGQGMGTDMNGLYSSGGLAFPDLNAPFPGL